MLEADNRKLVLVETVPLSMSSLSQNDQQNSLDHLVKRKNDLSVFMCSRKELAEVWSVELVFVTFSDQIV